MTSIRKKPSQTVLKLQIARDSNPKTTDIIRKVQGLPPPPTKDFGHVCALQKFDQLSTRGDLVESPPKIRKQGTPKGPTDEHTNTIQESDLKRCRSSIVLLSREGQGIAAPRLSLGCLERPRFEPPLDAVLADPASSSSSNCDEDAASTSSIVGGFYRLVPSNEMGGVTYGRDSVASLSSAASESGQSETSAACSDVSTTPPSSEHQSACKWRGCRHTVDGTGLLMHVEREHLQLPPASSPTSLTSPTSKGSTTKLGCQWQGCKVFGQTSKSSSCEWLERHVLKHVPGAKPFCCIVSGCGERFGSRFILQRHVEGHFSAPATPPGASAPGSVADVKQRPRSEESAAALQRLKKRKLKGRRRCTRKPEDFFDPSIIEQLQRRLVHVGALWEGVLTEQRDAVTFTSEVAGRRTDSQGRKQLLLRWRPHNVMDDCWILESARAKHQTRTLPIAELQQLLSQI